ncbi:MAG: sigma-54-dependent Fis family transcriptional regulator, partial [Deltaproteobacteria bacterium]|nr:sigma-54-dependent Fis family transcriptional regulator [Deltaproteobacteria bacterium]
LLLFHALLQAGDAAGARARLRAAIAQRDRVAHALPAALQARLLGRRDLCELRRLELEWEGGAATAEAGPACASERVFHSRRERSEAREGDAGVLWRTSRSPTDASDRAAGCETPSEKPPAAAPRPPRRVLVGSSAPMLALKAAIARVAPTDAMVLITGETGTGKELVAEAIHEASPRRTGPLVKVNCAALVETLLLSELFGHERGAFTGAAARRLGRFEVAAGGTLFLDEIGDISPRTQVALLRVLQDGRFERVGGCAPLRADVRVVCATHRDLRAMVDAGAFREDLYYRLCGVELRVPPLRERVADLPELAASLLGSSTQAAGRSPLALGREALCALRRHRWPGNVRELENALRVAALFARGPEIAVADLADNVEGLASLAPSAGAGGEGSVQAVPSTDTAALVYGQVRRGTALADMKKKLERECIARALGEAGGNITRAAALLGMKRPRLSQLVKECGLAPVLKEIKP